MKVISLVAGVMFLLLVVSGAGGSVLSIDLDTEISGAQSPTGALPWLRAEFDDGGTAGSVELTLTAVNLTGTEFVALWLFNLDSALDVTQLVFSAPTKTGSFVTPTISLSAGAFKADGDGFFDIKIAFTTSSDGGESRFGVGDAAVYTVTGIPTLWASSFNVPSSPGGGAGEYNTIARVRSIDESGSGWVASPEPATLGMLLVGALGILRRRNR